MKKSRFTETQIVKAIKEHESGGKDEELYRELGISTATFYKWKPKYGGMEANDVKRLKELEAENAKLNGMYANLSLVHDAPKDAVE